jgi:putative ABC transport system permease protein
MNHLQLAFRNLQRRPTRSILTLLGVAVAVGSFITLYGLSRSVNENVQQAFEERGNDLTVRRRGIAEPFGGTVPEQIIPDIAKISGVAGVSGQLLTFAATDNDDHVIAFGWPENSFFWSSVPLADGRLPNPAERKFALVGKDIANTLGKNVGDDITLLGDKFHIVGITNYTSVINRNAVIVGLSDLQEATFRTGSVTFIAVRLANPADKAATDRIAKTIESLGEFAVTRGESVLKNDSLVGLLDAVSSSMAWVALLMGVLMVLNTLLMAVLERTREIGILSAIGWSKERIMGALVIEGFLLSALGSALGILLGIGGSRLLSAIPAIGRYIAVRPTLGLIVDRSHRARHSRLVLSRLRSDAGKPSRSPGASLKRFKRDSLQPRPALTRRPGAGRSSTTSRRKR